MMDNLKIPPTEVEVAEAIEYLNPKCRDVIRRLAFQRDALMNVLSMANNLRTYCMGSDVSSIRMIKHFDEAVCMLSRRRSGRAAGIGRGEPMDYPKPEVPPLRIPEQPIAALVELINDQRAAIKQLQEIAEKHTEAIKQLQRSVHMRL